MIQTLDEIIGATIALPVQDKLALFRALSLALEQDRTFSALNATFWEQRSLADLIADQQVPVATDLSDLAADFWPANETADEFIAYVRERRAEDRATLSSRPMLSFVDYGDGCEGWQKWVVQQSQRKTPGLQRRPCAIICPLVTNNATDFENVLGLEVRTISQ